MHELIVAVSRVAQKDPNLMIDEQSKEFWKWRETIQHHENLMLEVLCFDLDPGLPYPILYDFLKTYNVRDNKKLRNVSWAIVTDSFSTILCLLVQPQSIAGGALYLGLKHTGVRLPNDEEGRPWWDALGLDIGEVETVLEMMLSTYENPQVPRTAEEGAYVRDVDTMRFDHTRQQTPGGSVEGDGDVPRAPSGGTGSGNGNGQSQRIPNKEENNGNTNHTATNGTHIQERDQEMEDVRGNERSGSEEGELG